MNRSRRGRFNRRGCSGCRNSRGSGCGCGCRSVDRSGDCNGCRGCGCGSVGRSGDCNTCRGGRLSGGRRSGWSGDGDLCSGRSGGFGGGYRQHDAIGLDEDGAVGYLGQRFNVDVGVATDLKNCSFDGLSVDDEGFVGRVLRGKASRESQKTSQPDAESKIMVFVHDVQFTRSCALTCEATIIVHRRGFHRGDPQRIKAKTVRQTSRASGASRYAALEVERSREGACK